MAASSTLAPAAGWRACGPRAGSRHSVPAGGGVALAVWGGEPACLPARAPPSQRLWLQPFQNNLSDPAPIPAPPVPSF